MTPSRTLSKQHANMFNMSTWLDGRTINLEYVEIHFSLVLSYEGLIFLRTTPFNHNMRLKKNIISQIRSR
jgi:hypothetical protein